MFCIFFLQPVLAVGEVYTGFYLSLGQMHYSIKSFSGSQNSTISGEPADLFFGVTLAYKNTAELNLLYNRATGEIQSGADRLIYDMDGFGIEAGKIIAIHLFKKNNFAVSADVVVGGYYMFFPFKNISVRQIEAGYLRGKGGLYYQTGFYWSTRLKYRMPGKISLNLGFKSFLPVRGNEFSSLDEENVLLFKSFFYVGVVF